eukprot:scaffold10744_cov162-Skeletonema_marinoi.AAC.4
MNTRTFSGIQLLVLGGFLGQEGSAAHILVRALLEIRWCCETGRLPKTEARAYVGVNVVINAFQVPLLLDPSMLMSFSPKI